MCANLLILESPGKVKKVQSFLGPDWKVVASVGHVRDLPVKEMGVSAPDFKPYYQPTGGADVLKDPCQSERKYATACVFRRVTGQERGDKSFVIRVLCCTP